MLDFDLVTKEYLLKQLDYFDKTLCEIKDCPDCNADPVSPSGNVVAREGVHSSESRRPNLSGNFTYSADKIKEDGTIQLQATDINLSTKVCIFNPSREILILKDNGSDWWDLPGGHVADGESIEKGLHREVKEETDLTITACKQLFIQSIELGDPPEDRPVVFFVGSAYGDITLSDEHLAFLWVAEEDLDDYNLGVFIPIIKQIYKIVESDNYDDIVKFAPGHEMDVTDLGKPDLEQTYIHKFAGPSAEMMNSTNADIVNNPEARNSGPTETQQLLDAINEHRQHVKIEPPIITKTGYSEAGNPAEREALYFEASRPTSIEAGPIQTTSSAAVIDKPDDDGDGIQKEAAGGTGIAGEGVGSVGTAGVLGQDQSFSPTYGGQIKKKEEEYNFNKQNATDISTGVAASTSFRPATNDLYDGQRNQNGSNRPYMRPEQRPIGEGETPLWLNDDLNRGDDYLAPNERGANVRVVAPAKNIVGNNDPGREQFVSLSSDLQPFIKKSEDNDLHILTRGALRKANNGRPLIVGGWGNYNITDREGHRITPKALRPAVTQFLSNPEFANVNIFHSSIQVGQLIPAYTDSEGQKWTTHVTDEGFYAVVEFRTDIEVARKAMAEVLKGNLRGFSLSGNSAPESRRQVCDSGHCWTEIDELESIYELTLCQVPMNQGSWVTDIIQVPDEEACPECYNQRSGQYDGSMRPI